VSGVLRLAWLAGSGRRNAMTLGVFTFFAAGCFAVSYAAVELVGAFELSLLSTAGRLGTDFPVGWRTAALSIRQMLELFFPYAPQRPFGVYYSPGVLALVGALLALYSAARRKTHLSLAVSMLLLMVFGGLILAGTPLYTTLARFVPFLGRASLIPAGLIFLFLPVVILAAVGVERLVESRRRLVGTHGYVVPLVIFAELFAVFGVVYPLRGDRRLTYDYRREVADFPHLDAIRETGHPGRIVTYPTREGMVLAPSYATMERGLSRLNLHLSAFAPDAVTGTLDRAVRTIQPGQMEVLGVGWVVSCERISGRTPDIEVKWPSCLNHFENSLYWPLRNQPGWLGWDKTVRLYRVCDKASMIRTGPAGTLEAETEFMKMHIDRFDSWRPAASVQTGPNSFEADVADTAAARAVFAAVTAYPGWKVYANGEEIAWNVTADGMMAAKLPEHTTTLLMRFRPSRWGLSLAASMGAFLFALVGIILDLKSG